MKKSNNKKGFTLVELVIVVAVIAILSAILIPTIGTVIKDAKDAAVKSDLRTVITNKMAENKEEVPAGYFFYSENGTTITYALKWTGSEIEILTETDAAGHFTISDDTIKLDSSYSLALYTGKFYTAKLTEGGEGV